MFSKPWLLPEVKKVIDAAQYPEDTLALLQFTQRLIVVHHLNFTAVQLAVLTNHLAEMVARSKEQRALDMVDETLFSDVSQQSLGIARAITDKLGNLAKSEPFILSIHFENVRQQ